MPGSSPAGPPTHQPRETKLRPNPAPTRHLTGAGRRGPTPAAAHDHGPKRIVYLFGAGATHAELKSLYPDLIDEQKGLLISQVSSRVIKEARNHKNFMRGVEMVSGASGSLNIELLISLIENSRVYGWERKTHLLKDLVRADILAILKEEIIKHFHLHKALFELHDHPALSTRERLTGLISLNYEDVLDRAWTHRHPAPNYCLRPETHTTPAGRMPLLKLHGAFSWRHNHSQGRRKPVEIIPMGSAKQYLHAPYCFIWNRALELLAECDILRVVGCSLSQNDFHLIDLLFKAHLLKGAPFQIEIIASDQEGTRIKKDYGFLPEIRTLTNIEPPLIPHPDPPNPFREWLRHKSHTALGDEAIGKTQHLKKIAR